MEYVTLSGTNLSVSRVGFGSEPLGGTDWGRVDVRDALDAVSRASDLGVNLFDTADVYGLGRSEELLSRGLGSKRHDAVIVTKFGVSWSMPDDGGRARTFYDASPSRVREALEGSLRRLRVDCIPLYLIHWPDPKTPIGDTLEALQRCQEAGKVRYMGVSNFSAELIREAHSVSPLAAVECQYNLVDRTSERGVLSCCRDLDISVLAYGPLAQGLLTGKYAGGATFLSDDRRHRLSHFGEAALSENLGTISRMNAIHDRDGRSLPQIAIRWVLDAPGVSCAIAGAKSPWQAEDNAAAMSWRLSREEWDYLANGRSLEPSCE